MLTCAESADLKFVFNMPGQILDGLSEGMFDLAVMEMCDCFDLSAHASFPLPSDETLFVTAPDLRVPSPETRIEVLFEVPLFTRREGCCSRTLLETNLKAIGHDLRDFRKIIVLDDLHLVVRAVLDGQGCHSCLAISLASTSRRDEYKLTTSRASLTPDSVRRCRRAWRPDSSHRALTDRLAALERRVPTQARD